MTTTRNARRTLQGVVTSTKAAKTITVEVERTFRHRKYGKFVRCKKKYMVHDEADTAQDGDRVEIAATRPLSKHKRWRLVQLLDRTPRAEAVADAAETSESVLAEVQS